jgi:hypothetical protein
MVRSIAIGGSILLVLLAIQQCTSSAEKRERLTALALIETAERCEEYGGQMRRVCLLGTQMCIVEYADAGESCISSLQCEGACVLEESRWDNVLALGQCSRSNDPCGCRANVELGIVMNRICAD